MAQLIIKYQIRTITMKRQKGRVSHIPLIKEKRVGEYGIISRETGRISSAHISSVILTLKRQLPADTSIIPRIYGHIAVTKKPLEVRMGKGKGSIAKKIARIRTNSILFEITKINKLIPNEIYIEALKIAGSKLPVRTKIIKYNSK